MRDLMVSSGLHKFFLVALLLILIAGKTFATTYDWVGTTLTGGVYNWNNKLNWQVGGAAASATPGPADDVNIAVNAFSNNPTITDAQKCASITFGVYDNFMLTINGTLMVSGNITQNNDPNLDQNTILTGTGTITCNNLNLGDSTQPSSGTGVVMNISSQINQFTINGNIVLNSAGNGGNGIEYPYFSLDSGKVSLYGQIITKTYNSPTLEGVGDPAYPGYGLFQMDSYADNTTLELLNIAPVSTPILSGFTVDFTNDGTGKGTVIYDATSGTQTVYTTGTTGLGINAYNYDYLTFAGASAKTIIGGALTIGNDWTTGGTGAVNLATNNPIITVNGNWTNTTNITQGTGAVTTNGAFQNTTGTVTCGTGDMVFKGGYTNGKTFTAGTGTVYFSGVSQTITDNSTTGTIFNNVTFNCSGTVTINAGTANFAVASKGVLTMVSPAKLIAGTASAAYLTLKSDVTGSATVAAITGSSTITGNVNVQRLITGGAGHRGYRLISSPVYNSTVSSNKVYSINYIINSCYLTGTTGTSGGFDKTGNPTIYLFRENLAPLYTSYLNSNFRGVNNLTSAPSYQLDVDGGPYNIPAGNGIMFFFRGNRSAATLAAETISSYVATSATLTASGTLNQGQVTVKNWYTPASANLGRTTATANTSVRGYNLVGNPYASSIDWETFNSTSTTTGIYGLNIKPTFYVYNGISKNYAAYTQGGGGVGTNGGTNIIPSGQGFFVLANSSAGKLIFNESAKVTSQPTTLLMGKPVDVAAIQYLRLQLAQDTINTDDLVIRFSNTAHNDYVVNEDAPYKQGFGNVSICSISDNHIDLAINEMPFPKTSELIGINVNTIAGGTYKLNLTQIVNIPRLYDIWLMDAYKKDSLDMRQNPTYSFNVDKGDSTTFGSKRFSLLIRQNPAYAYHLLNFTANKVITTKQVQLVWKTENEANYTHFTVERSTDGGKTYDVVGGTTSTDQGTYSLVDKAPGSSQNLYRLKQVDLNGTITFSNIVTVMYSDKSDILAGKVNVYPNPASSVINLAIAPDVNAGLYQISITNSSGVVIKQNTFAENSWQSNVNNLLPGTYLIQVVNGKNKSVIGQTKFVKL